MKTLVLVGHGSSHEQRMLEPVYDHAEAVRDAAPVDTVRGAFAKGEPALADVVDSVDAGTLVVVPVFMSDGYFASTVIPRTLDAHRDRLDIRYTPPVGTHEAMAEVVLNRIEAAIDGFAEREEIGVALLGHGSKRHPDSSKSVREHATRLRERDLFAEVRSFFLEEPPHVDAITRECEADRLVVVPLFMAEGHHVREDIPKKLGVLEGECGPDGRAVRYTDPVGTHPDVAAIVFDRATAALEEPTDSPTSGPHREVEPTSTGGISNE